MNKAVELLIRSFEVISVFDPTLIRHPSMIRGIHDTFRSRNNK